MNRLRWYLARQGDRIPLLTLLAWLTVISLIAAMLWLFMLKSIPEPVQQSETQQNNQVQTLIQPSSEVLLAGAPKLVQVTRSLEILYQLAEQHQLSLEEVVYQDRPTQDSVLLEYAIDFRVQQTYPRIKAFITELLVAIPYLALEQISFEREDINSNQIQSHCRFKLFLERGNG